MSVPPVDFERYGLGDLSVRIGTKWARDGGETIAAWIADMDFPIADAVKAALIEVIGRDDLGYPGSAIHAEICDLFAMRMADRFDLHVERELVRTTTDVVQAISLLLATLSDEGDAVLTLTPAYPPYFPLVSPRRRLVAVDLVRGPDRYELDFDAVARAIAAEAPRVLLLCNPHNPTGRVLTAGELTRLGELALGAGCVIVSDEIHADLVYPPARHIAIGTLSPELARRTVTLTSASKAFNLAGLRCGFVAFGSPELARGFDALAFRSRGEVNVLGMVATRAAWTAGEPWLAAVRGYLAANRDYVGKQLSGVAGIELAVPEATYLAWLDCRGADLGEEPASFLARRARVALSPGTDYGTAGAGHARLNFATGRPLLTDICARIIDALSSASRS